jgi:hypothetical protein
MRKAVLMSVLLLWSCQRSPMSQNSEMVNQTTPSAEINATSPNSQVTDSAMLSTTTASVPVMSVNAYKVPYLGLDGTFYLNQGDKEGYADARRPKRVVVTKMQKFSFYSDAAGKHPIAQNCVYTYLGTAKDPKFYAEFKGAVWDLFELEADDKLDPKCQKFKHLTIVPPHGEPTHMHIRYGDEKNNATKLLNMSQAEKPWFPTYCGIGKTVCNEQG